MSEAKRLFVGVRVSVATANALAHCAEQLARRARDANLDLKWVEPANYHVTLKFLGWAHAELIAALDDRLAAAVAGLAPFKLRTARLGAFPAIEKASLLWAGVDEPSGALAGLAATIEAMAVGLGFAAEPRPFHAHVTLARSRETRSLKELVLPMSEQMFSDTRIEGVTLFESEMKSSGSVYTEISRIGFKTPDLSEKRQTGAVELGDETD
ncbi:MAG: RNA 2',3'-cyclic phosphodiesterase, partial [Kofleriaceae bacterium]